MQKRGIISRRSLLAAPAILMFPRGLIVPAHAYSHGCGASCGFPGQPGNPVGFAAAPGFPGFGAPVSIGTTLTLTSGSPGSPNIVSFKDIVPRGGFDGTSNTISTSGFYQNNPSGAAVHDITFVGCRFSAQSNGVIPDTFCDLYSCGSTNITFQYCTFAPLVGLNPNPIPSLAWPSSGVGKGNVINSSVYQIPWLNGARDCITAAIPVGSTVILDHCDMWGAGELVGTSGGVWTTANLSPSNVNGQITIVNCWLHDNRLPIAPVWSSGTNYGIGAFVSGSDFNNYQAAMISGPGNGGAFDPVGDLSGHWNFFATFDHGNGVIPTNSAGGANFLVDHCTISGQGNTKAISFAELRTIGTFWQTGVSYNTNNEVLSVDGYAYRAARNNNSVDPTGNLHTADWTQFGFNGYQNMAVRNTWFSGGWAAGIIDFGIGNSGQTGMIFEDNVISNDPMWSTRLCSVTGASNAGPYSPNQSGIFTGAPSNSWRRNRYFAPPGSSAWDPDHFNQDGQFVWPGSVIDGGTTIRPTDWPNS